MKALPCSVISAVSILSTDEAGFSVLICCGWAPAGLKTPVPGIAEGMKFAEIVLVGGIMAPNVESLLFS